jgi:uncharacterized membrane protein
MTTSISPEKQRLGVVWALLGWCAALLAVRMSRGADLLTVGLGWNLVLATLPLLWSTALKSAHERGQRVWAGVFFALWLLFLPNAPYLLTDLIHLGPRPNVPLWFLLAMLLSCAGAGTLLGYFSLLDVHALVEKERGQFWGWAVAIGALMACGFGIYVGRFLRWNSWDALTNPLRLARSLASQFIDSGPHPHPIPVTLVFGIGLVVGYAAVRSIGRHA